MLSLLPPAPDDAATRAPSPRPAEEAARRRPCRSSRALFAALLGLWASLATGTAGAVLLAAGDGTGNTTPPAADPGFGHVGDLNGLTGVYVRNGWVLTAGHVGVHPIDLGGVVYQPIPGSGVWLENPDGSPADLLAFKLASRPPLPDLSIASVPPAANDAVVLIGNGRNRGAATSWLGLEGWLWGTGRAIRWGTNRIEATDQMLLGTAAFTTAFDDLRGPAGRDEADVVNGDSGGAVFAEGGPGSELIGILYARATFAEQPAGTSLYGNLGLIADLHVYRDEILAVIDRPDCDDGLDDDGDGLVDWGLDPGCTSPFDGDERDPALACDNGLDDDGDGLADEADPGCLSPLDPSERGALYECDNGLDDDGDGLFDYPDDDGCLHPTNPVEAPEPTGAWPIGLGALAALAARRPRRAAQASIRSTR